MENCVFCKIVKGELPVELVYQDAAVFAFLDINPVQFGHTLVIPRKHFPSMHESPDSVVESVFLASKKLMPLIQKAMHSDYVAVSVVGLDVPHFHVHIIPRYFNDGLAKFWPTKKYEGTSLKDVAYRIKALL